MAIDYKLATKAIDRAMRGIDSLVGNYRHRLPALAFAQAYATQSSRLEAPNPLLYRKGQEPPTLDEKLRNAYGTPEVPKANMTAREAFYRLLML